MALNHIVQGTASYSTSGSPTIVDGVVSGFSDRNVLVISPTFTPTYSSFEIVLKIKTGADVTTAQKIFTSQYGANNENRFGFVIGISGGKITHQSTVDGTSWANESTGTTTLLAETDYYIKCVRNASTITYFLSTNNETWTQEISTSFSSPNVNFIITYIGNFYSYVVGEDYAFAGSLDLKGTYIKTNSSAWFGKCPVEVKHISLNSNSVNYVVKDNKLVFADSGLYLTGPVTYTKVGSPTIVDGVLSGINKNNYLNSSSVFPSIATGENFDIMAKFTTPSTFDDGEAGSYMYILGFGASQTQEYGFTAGIRIQKSSGKLNLVSPMFGLTFDTALSTNTTYYVRFYRTNGQDCFFGYSLDKENWISATNTSTTQMLNDGFNYRFIIGASNLENRSALTGGKIDLNETYVILNNSLWLYGKNYATQNIAPVPSGYTYGTTTTSAIGFVDMRTQQFTAAPAGTTLVKDV